MNRQVLLIEHEGGRIDQLWPADMDALVKATGDAQLLACAAFLASRRKGETVVLQEFAALLNVTDWTIARWLKTLIDKGLLTYSRVDDGMVKIALRCPTTSAAPPKPQEPKPEPKAAPEAAQAAARTNITPEPKQAALNNAHSGYVDAAIAVIQGAPAELLRAQRLKGALDTYQVCEVMLARTSSAPAVTKALTGIVQNPMFARLDLPKELLDADAWLLAKGHEYKDMARFLVYWMRNAVKFAERSRPKNAHAPRAGKYTKLAGAAKGKP